MANVNVTLNDGLTVGETRHLIGVLREVTAGDLIEATEESEKLQLTPEGYALVVSNTMVGLHTLRRQIVNIGDHPGPLTLGELKKLSGRDLNALQAAAVKLDQVSLSGVTQQGE